MALLPFALVGVPEQALGGLGFGLTLGDNPVEVSCTQHVHVTGMYMYM